MRFRAGRESPSRVLTIANTAIVFLESRLKTRRNFILPTCPLNRTRSNDRPSGDCRQTRYFSEIEGSLSSQSPDVPGSDGETHLVPGYFPAGCSGRIAIFRIPHGNHGHIDRDIFRPYKISTERSKSRTLSTKKRRSQTTCGSPPFLETVAIEGDHRGNALPKYLFSNAAGSRVHLEDAPFGRPSLQGVSFAIKEFRRYQCTFALPPAQCRSPHPETPGSDTVSAMTGGCRRPRAGSAAFTRRISATSG